MHAIIIFPTDGKNTCTWDITKLQHHRITESLVLESSPTLLQRTATFTAKWTSMKADSCMYLPEISSC